MQQDVRATQSPHLHQRLGAGGQVAVGDQRSFGPAGGAGGIEQSRRRVVRQLHGILPGLRGPGQLGKGTPVAAEPLQPEIVPCGQGSERFRLVGIADEEAGSRIRQERLHLPLRVGRVHGVEDGTGLEAGMGQEHGLDAFSDPDRDSVARFDAAGRQRPGGVVDGRQYVAGGEGRATRNDEGRVAARTVAVQGVHEVAACHGRLAKENI